MIAWAIVFLVAGQLLAHVLRPKPKTQEDKPLAAGELVFPTATEGRVIPLLWGQTKIEGPNVVWFGHVRTRAITSQDVIQGYQYSATIQFALCRGPGVELIGVYVYNDENLLGYNATGAFWYVRPFSTSSWKGQLEKPYVYMQGHFYDGSETQLPPTELGAYISSLPAFRGTSYFVVDGITGVNSTLEAWKFLVARYPDGLGLDAMGFNKPGSGTVNPMSAVYEILTNTEWGLEHGVSDVNIVNFIAAGETLFNEGNGFAMYLDKEIEASELLEEIERQIDGALWFDRGAGQWNVTLRRNDYTTGTLIELDDSNSELIEYSRQTWEETTNQVRVEFSNYENSYKTSYGFAQDSGNEKIQGVTVAAEVKYPGVRSKKLANDIAWRDLRTLAYPIAKLKLKAGRLAYMLRPGSLLKHSSTNLGYSNVVFRVASVNPGTLEHGKMELACVEDIFYAGTGTFGEPEGTGWSDPIDAYVATTPADVLSFEAPRQLVVKQEANPTVNPRAWCGSVDTGGGTNGFNVYSKLASTFALDHTQHVFIPVGTLKTAFSMYESNDTRPSLVTSIDVTVADISELVVGGNASSVGALLQIVYIGGEFIGYELATDFITYLRLKNVYRGLFNSNQLAHSVGEKVWFIGGRTTSTTTLLLRDSDAAVSVQLRSLDISSEATEAETATKIVTLDKIYKQPLPLRDPVINSTYADTSDVSLDIEYTVLTGRIGNDAKAVLLNCTPRAWRIDDVTTDHNLASSSPTYLGDSPVVEYVYTLDPAGTPVVLSTVTAADPSDPEIIVLRNDMIIAVGANATIPSTTHLSITPKHTPPEYGVQIVGSTLEHDFTIVSSILSDAITFGGLTVATASPAVVFNETGTYNFNLFTTLPGSGILEAEVNSGGYVTVVAASFSSGTLAITSGDSVVLRFTQSPAGDQFFSVAGPSENGHGVLKA